MWDECRENVPRECVNKKEVEGNFLTPVRQIPEPSEGVVPKICNATSDLRRRQSSSEEAISAVDQRSGCTGATGCAISGDSHDMWWRDARD
ncbi:hypothetical protein Tco_0471495 [Tanacetum coccineum]